MPSPGDTATGRTRAQSVDIDGIGRAAGQNQGHGQQDNGQKYGAKFEKNAILFDDSRGERGIFCTLKFQMCNFSKIFSFFSCSIKKTFYLCSVKKTKTYFNNF